MEITNRTQLYRYGFVVDTKNRCSKYDEGHVHLVVDFDPDPMAWSLGDRPLVDERGDALDMERPRREALFGATATLGGSHSYRVQSSPLEPRAILVGMPNRYKELWPQQEALYKQLDWAAIRKMVIPDLVDRAGSSPPRLRQCAAQSQHPTFAHAVVTSHQSEKLRPSVE